MQRAELPVKLEFSDWNSDFWKFSGLISKADKFILKKNPAAQQNL